MDCRTALEILEVARPGSDDLSDPELAEAAAHVESHADCRREFERRQQLDREIGLAMRDVPVPHDLKGRLLALLADRAEPAEAAVVAAPQPQARTPLHRRVLLRVAAGAAACVVLAIVALQFLPAGPEPIEIAGLPEQVWNLTSDASFFGELTDLDQNGDTELPVDWSSAPRGLTVEGPKSYIPQERSGPAIALYRLGFSHRGKPVPGYLLILPADRVHDAPQATQLSRATTEYGNRIAWRSWTEGELVYVCVVPGGDDVEALLRLLYRPTA